MPCAHLRCHVYAALHSFLYPAELHVVDVGGAAEVDVCPLLSAVVAHPCAAEVACGLQVGHGVVAIEEFYLRYGPVCCSRHVKVEAQMAQLRGATVAQRHVQLYDAQWQVAAACLLVGVAAHQLLRLLAGQRVALLLCQCALLRRYGHGVAALCLVGVVGHGAEYLHAACLHAHVVPLEVEPRLIAHDVDVGVLVAVDGTFALAT